MNLRRLLRLAVACSFAIGLVVAGCSGCESELSVPTSDRCPDRDCKACEDHADCGESTFCGEVNDQSVCVLQECQPGAEVCEDGGVARCDHLGSGFQDPVECTSGECEDGQCLCDDDDECGQGESCIEGSCSCPTEVRCGAEGVCCGPEEVCEQTEVCEDGDCEYAEACQPECAGEYCGEEGELCCEGETPVCGPFGECVADCGADRELCGEDFDECCPQGDVCVFGDCRTPGQACEFHTECDFDEYCDDALGKCMPDDFPEGLVCEVDEDFDEFESDFLWHWDGVEVDGYMHDNVAMTPKVADMTGDGVPEVVVNAYPDVQDDWHMPAVIDGETGETVYHNDTRWVRRWSQVVLADVTDNDRPEIVVGNSSGVGVIEDIVSCSDPSDSEAGCYLWWNSDVPMHGESQVVADVDADGNAEIVVNDTVLDAESGDVVAQGGQRGYDYTVAADITDDGTMEWLSSECLLEMEDGEIDEVWCNSELPGDGRRFVAVGDISEEDDREGNPEFVITGDSNVYVVAADDGELLHQFAVPGGGNGGPPVVADFDGDGGAEFGIASQGCYTVFDLDCLGSPDEDYEGCERPEIEACPDGVNCYGSQACPDLPEDQKGTGDGILWSIYIQDISSSRTGSSVFDFQGNGRNEVVYNDECLLMVFDGQTGEHVFRHPNTTRTASEYPIVVDVNADTRTNFVVAANNDRFSRDCEDPMQNEDNRYPECHEQDPPEWCTEGTTGVFALEDPEDRWVRTRQIWNQFAYFIDNVEDDATIPTSPDMPWESHNTFRANRQGEIPLHAPDVVVSNVQVNDFQCPPEDLRLVATIENQGKSVIDAGLPVTLYDADSGEAIETIELDEPISPGGLVTVEFTLDVSEIPMNQEMNYRVAANDDGTNGESVVSDCNPERASSEIVEAICVYEG